MKYPFVLSLLLIFLILIGCNHNSQVDYTWAAYGLKGKVKYIALREAHSAAIGRVDTMRFNNSGQLLEVDFKGAKKIYTYKGDTVCVFHKNDIDSSYTDIYIRNWLGNLTTSIESENINPQTTICDTVDFVKNGNSIIGYKRLPSGKKTLDRSDFYDEKKRIIKAECYNDKGKMWQVLTYAYDNSGNRVAERYDQYFKRHRAESIHKIYNDERDVVLKIDSSSLYMLLTYRYQYEYDTIGNWVKKDEYEDGILQTRSTRQIEYYK